MFETCRPVQEQFSQSGNCGTQATHAKGLYLPIGKWSAECLRTLRQPLQRLCRMWAVAATLKVRWNLARVESGAAFDCPNS